MWFEYIRWNVSRLRESGINCFLLRFVGDIILMLVVKGDNKYGGWMIDCWCMDIGILLVCCFIFFLWNIFCVFVCNEKYFWIFGIGNGCNGF